MQAALELAVNKTLGRVLETQYLKETLGRHQHHRHFFQSYVSHRGLKFHVAEDTLTS